MSSENEENEAARTGSNQREYPFGLSRLQFAGFVMVVGLIGPGFLVYALEQANLSGVADFVWMVGYGTTIFVVWFIWLRPLNLVGPSGQEISLTEESEQSETAPDEGDSESEPSNRTESSTKDSTLATEDNSKESTRRPSGPPDSK
jgi:hypothetical protein